MSVTQKRLVQKFKNKLYRPNFLYPYSINEVRKRIIFIHIPKNAGTALSMAINGTDRPRVHEPCRVYQEKFPVIFDKSFKFCIIRNPISRFGSTLNYILSGGNQRPHDISIMGEVREHIKNGSLFTAETISYLAGKYPLFKPQCFYIFDQKGTIMVDKMYSFEDLSTLSEDLSKMKNFV